MEQATLKNVFSSKFSVAPEVTCHAPGRVNLIGDHTDYNDGFVLPAAINFGTSIAASKRNDNMISVVAHDIDSQVTTFSLNSIEFDNEYSWSNYVRGVLKALLKEFPAIKGANLVVSGNVPQGAGLSSSASFEIALIKAISELYELSIDGVKAALLGQAAENNFVGCSCGIMDQLISAMGKENHAMLLDCRSLTFEDAPIPDDLAVLIVNSNVKRGLVDSEYNTRRQQCESVAEFFEQKFLRDVGLEELQSAQGMLEPILYRRAYHVITENLRTLEALDCLKSDKISQLGQLMRQSHQSLKDDFEVTTPEMDFLANWLNDKIGSQGGARMTGGGFGGCVVALLPAELVDESLKDLGSCYNEKFGLHADVYICSVKQGAFRL